jgi:TolA-binding protein
MKRRLALVLPAVLALACSGGGSSGGSSGPLSDSALYAKAVQDYNAKAYTTAKGEFQELLSRASATAYYDKSTIYVAAIDYYEGYPATCLSALGSPTPPVSGFFQSYPSSAELDRARYWHGRCEMGLTPPDYLTARGDFTAVIGMTGSSYQDNSYFWRGRTYYGTAVASRSESSQDWASALADFDTVVTSFGTGKVAPEAQYWKGRTHFARGDAAKARGTQTGDALAQSEYGSAKTELAAQLSSYPGSTWAPDVNVYIGRTDLELAAWAADPVSACTGAANELFPWLGTTSAIRDDANYWYGRALYAVGAAHEATTPPDWASAKAQYQAAQAQFQKFVTDAGLSTSKLADNASYWSDRCTFSLADVVKTQADAAVAGATYADAQAGFATAQGQLTSTKTNSQFATSNVLDWVQVYTGRAQFEQGYCADRQNAGSGAAFYAAAQGTFAGYFAPAPAGFGSTLPSAAAAHYWSGRTYYAQGNLASAIADFDAVVTGWDWVGIATTTKPTTTWWDNSQYYLVRAYSDQATGASCQSAQSAYGALKAAIPTDPLLAQACTYMTAAGRCPTNTCP